MGRLASGAGLRTFLGASVAFLWGSSAFAQVPVPPSSSKPPAASPPAGDVLKPVPPPPPAAEPTPPPAPPATQPRPPASPAPAPAREAVPPLDPPVSQPPASRPAFLHTAAEMDSLKPLRAKRERPATSEPPRAEPASARAVPPDFVLRSSPWVDFTLTSFHLEDRTGNFLNLGVQFGGYLFERLRVAARLVTPLEEASDGYNYYGSSQFDGTQSREQVKARSMSMLYEVSAGLLITNSKTFAFAPSVELQRTDVAAYGSALSLGLPFEWTTPRHLRVGFEFALGYAFGGSVREACRNATSPPTSCGVRTTDRPAGSSVLVQYVMGWSLGAL